MIGRAARLVVLGALLWSLGCLAAAVNWHSWWRKAVAGGGADSYLAVQAQERWQFWVDMTLVGVVVTVLGLALAVWQVVRAAGDLGLDRVPTEAELREIRGR